MTKFDANIGAKKGHEKKKMPPGGIIKISLLLFHQEYSMWSYLVRSRSITFEVQGAVSSHKPQGCSTGSRRQGLRARLVYCGGFTPLRKHLHLTGSHSSVSLFFRVVPSICCKAFLVLGVSLFESPNNFGR